MVFSILGLNYKTAPLTVREKVALSPEQIPVFLEQITTSYKVEEAFLLSTCNRTELFCTTHHPEQLLDIFAQHHHFTTEYLRPYTYTLHGLDAVQHALRLAVGLDSMMLGEPQILGQLKNAYHTATTLKPIQSTLRALMEFIFKTAKRIRYKSHIGKNPLSVAYAAAQLVAQWCPQAGEHNTLLIGSGETATLVSKYLSEQKRHRFFIASRTQTHAETLAHNVAGTTIPITELSHHIHKMDIIVSATACPIPFIQHDMIRDAMPQRNHRPMFLLDLAIPRDIEPSIAELPGITLYNIDDLHLLTQQNLEDRKSAALIAENLIALALQDYLRWQQSRYAGSTITAYRKHMSSHGERELCQALQKLSQGHDPAYVLQQFHYRLMNKLLHAPSLGLRETAKNGRSDLFELMEYLYNFPELPGEHEKIN